MKWKTTAVLFLLVVVLGSFLWWYVREQSGTEERRRRARWALHIDPKSATFLQIEQSNTVVQCEKREESWWLTEPLLCRANGGEVQRVLVGLSELPKNDTIPREEWENAGVSLEAYGLVFPRASFTVEQEMGRRTIHIGNDAPVGDLLYVLETNRQDIVATSNTLLALVPESVDLLRSRRLFHAASSTCRRVDIQRNTGFLQLVRNETGSWMIRQPVEGRANGLLVQDLANKFFGARVDRFVADGVSDFTPYGLAEGVAKVTIWPDGDELPYEIFLGEVVEDDADLLYAKTGESDSVYAVSRRLLTEANYSPDVFRDRQLLDFRSAAVTVVEIRDEDTLIELRKDDAGSWAMNKPVQRPAEDDWVVSLITDWESVPIEAFLLGAPEGWEDEPAVLNLVLAGGPSDGEEKVEEGMDRITLAFYPSQEENTLYRVRVGDEATLYTIRSGPVKRLSTNPLDYYNRSVLRLVAEDIHSIDREIDEDQLVVERDEAGIFQPASITPGRVVLEVVDRILAEIAGLRVLQFVTEDPNLAKAYGLENPSALLTLGLTGDAGIRKTIVFGQETPEGEGVYAMIRGQETVFILPSSIRDLLTSDFLIRSVQPVESGHSSQDSTKPTDE